MGQKFFLLIPYNRQKIVHLIIFIEVISQEISVFRRDIARHSVMIEILFDFIKIDY